MPTSLGSTDARSSRHCRLVLIAEHFVVAKRNEIDRINRIKMI